MADARKVLGVVALFREPEALRRAAEKARDAGWRRWDCHTPHPVHGLSRAMGLSRSFLPLIAIPAAFFGAASGKLMQWWMSAWDYPLIIGGTPLFSIPAFAPVAFETFVLCAALATFAVLLIVCGLFSNGTRLFTTRGSWRASRATATLFGWTHRTNGSTRSGRGNCSWTAAERRCRWLLRTCPKSVAQPPSAVKTLEFGKSIAEGFTAGGLRARTAALLCCATIVRHAPRPMRAWSYLFLIVFAFTVSFASFDWIMSLAPGWYSTMFGVYLFAGMAVTALSALTLAALGLKRAGALGPEIVNEDHLYSLGALMFAFSCFWGYIALSQYLLIWYGNLPEETVWFVDRWRGDWVGMSLALMGVRFVLPFLALLSRSAKTNPRRLVWVSCFLLAGQVVDLHWMILPQMPGGGPSGGPSAGPVLLLSDAGPLLLLTGLWLAEVGRFVGKHPMIAAGDPQWEESLRFELRI